MEIAEEAIRRIALLYKVEKASRSKAPEDRVALLQKDAKPVFDELETWLAIRLHRISGKSELAKAIRYALGRMKKLRGYNNSGINRNVTPTGLRIKEREMIKLGFNEKSE